MAYSTLVLKEMIIKVTFLLILLHLQSTCIYVYSQCPDNLVPCLNKTHCINIEQVCVDYHDCVDEHGDSLCHYCPTDVKDSIACITHVKPHVTFECLSVNQICNGKSDCINNEDEHLCGIQKCKHDYMICNNGSCTEKHLCNDYPDCANNINENNYCYNHLCGSDKIRCPNGACIDQKKMCDGFPHCSDGFDEHDCPHLTSITIKDSCSIPSNTFVCSSIINPICISNDRVCDGYQDCPMNEDESGCNKCATKSKCKTHPDIVCTQHPAIDQLCRCIKQGYQLTTDSSSCQDFNECNDSFGTYCSFNCKNTDGNFNCTCPVGSVLDTQTKVCRRINDQTKPNLLILFDDNISLFNIFNDTNRYSLQSFNEISIKKNHHVTHIQYDPYQMFVIYYNKAEQAILCKSNTTLKTIILISNVTINTFAYNANEKILFIIENQSRTLRMYTPIMCDISYQIKMHSWPLNNITDTIQSMEIDIYNRQIIFATSYEFLISNMSEPNITKVVYSTDLEIKRFIYDTSFKRIFWTTIHKKNNRIFPVYTCNNNFKQCQDTSAVLPFPWPFAFFNDGLIYPPLSSKPLNFIQLYGKERFLTKFITFNKENIHSLLYIDYQQADSFNLCLKNSSIIQCEDKICLQINSTNINCLSIDENIISNELIINLDSATNMQSLISNDIQLANKQNNFRYRPSNFVLFCIIAVGILATILAFTVKHYHKLLDRKKSDREQRQHEQYLVTNEPNLEEFNVVTDDRVSTQRVDYARGVLFKNSTMLLLGRRRDSI